MTEGEDRVHSASLHTQPGAEQAVVALPGYYQAIADDILASGDPVRLALDHLLSTFKSHVDGRDLLDELHPRKTLDIKRRVDGVETWFEGDWLSNVRDARDIAVTVLLAVSGATTASSVGMTSDARNAPNPPPKEAEPWRPIETAPKDGTKVDIWLEPVPELHAQFANGAKVGWRLPNAWFNGSEGAGWRNDGSYNGRQRNEVATHWMPLPSPPDQKKG